MIEITPTANEEITRLIESGEKGEATGMRLFVKGGGCAGLSYGMDFVEEPEETDKIVDLEGQYKLFIDKKSYLFLNGVVVDFKESLMGRGFTFENPNATGGCGCGTSFSVS